MKRCAFLVVLGVALASLVPSTFAAGTVQDRVSQRQDSISAGLARTWAQSRDEQAIERYLKEQGLEPVPVERVQELGAASNSTAVYLPGPSVWYDSRSRQYLISYHFYWKNSAWYSDSGNWLPCQWPFNCDVGGPDMWGIHLNTDSVLRLNNQRLTLYDSDGDLTDVMTQPVYNSGNNGAAFEYQDTVHTRLYPGPWYTTASGTMTLWMTKVSSGTVEIRSRMAHTWNSTSISGGSFSNSGLSLTFSSTSAKWDIQGSSITRVRF